MRANLFSTGQLTNSSAVRSTLGSRTAAGLRVAACAVLLGATTFGAAACVASSDGGASSSSAILLNPEASTMQALVTVTLPSDACQPGTTCAKVLGHTVGVWIDGTSVPLNAATTLDAGAHTLTVNGVTQPLTLSAGQIKTLVLPVVTANCTNAPLPTIPATDFGTTITASNAACPAAAVAGTSGVVLSSYPWVYSYNVSNWVPTYNLNCQSATNANEYSYWGYENLTGGLVQVGSGTSGCQAAVAAVSFNSLETGAYEAYPPGAISTSVSGVVQTLTLNAGDEVPFNITLPAVVSAGAIPATFPTTISFLSPRLNADAAKATITSSCSTNRSYTLPSSTATTLSLNAFVNSGCTYTLNVAGRTVALSQTQPNAISLNRLDVNNVTVTSDVGGPTTTAVGTYTIDFGGVQVAGPFTTPSGIDLLPGTYGFVLNFTDANGAQTQNQTLTL